MIARLMALLIFIGSSGAIVWIATREDGQSRPVASGSCIAQGREEIERRRAEGELSAEEAMMARQDLQERCTS